MAPANKVQPQAGEPKPFKIEKGVPETELSPANENATAALTLTLNGRAIRDRGEMLSLTDMWKAAGADDSRKPYAWLRGEDANRFIEHLGDSIGNPEARISRFGLVDVAKGGAAKGQTFAHWQIALAYAKYLSPAFHAACNVVIRERMEGRHQVPATLSPDLAEAIERTFGISRMSIHKVTAMESAVRVMQDALIQTRTEFMQALMESDPRAVAVGFKPSLEVLKDHDVPPKGRRGFSQKVSNRLRRYSLAHKHPMRESHETGRWLFHVDAIAGWLEAEGKSLILDQIDKVKGQGVLRLVRNAPPA